MCIATIMQWIGDVCLCYAVFTEFPSEVSLPLGSSSTLSCALKAPSNATVYWLYNKEPIDNSRVTYSITTKSELLEGNQFSMFYSKLEVQLNHKQLVMYTHPLL